jgi:syntaxin 1B/2/3
VRTEQISEIVQINGKYQKRVKELLDQMQRDFEESKQTYPKEPETRVKKTVHQTLTSKFRDVLRQSQQIQTEFKNVMQDNIKRQLKIVKRDATEEELDRLARDPEAAQAVMRERLIGPAHKKIQNAVDDIQNKYRDILKLE